MALRRQAKAHTLHPLGDTVCREITEGVAITSPRLLLLNHRQPRHPYLLHDLSAHPLLVRLYRTWSRVSTGIKRLYERSDRSDSLVHVLASGVFFTGFVKDMLCLPRPLSPPLSRISMSPSVSLEYGFPSTHSTNAVSVAVYGVFMLRAAGSEVNPALSTTLEILAYSYATSIVLGRLYCGMHGFLDVVVGAILGALLSLLQCLYGEAFDDFMLRGSTLAPLSVLLIVLVLVRIHPEPADDCPCFDDSIAFAGVIIGVEAGNWHYARTGYAWDFPVPATVPFELDALGWPKAVARIIIGVVVIFAWREVMKPGLLRYLPPLFRVVESAGLTLPRKFFVQAS